MAVTNHFPSLFLFLIDHSCLDVDGLLYLQVPCGHRDYLHAFLLEDRHELLHVLSLLLLVSDLVGHEDAVEIQIVRDQAVALDCLMEALRKFNVLWRDGHLVKVGGELAVPAKGGELARQRNKLAVRLVSFASFLNRAEMALDSKQVLCRESRVFEIIVKLQELLGLEVLQIFENGLSHTSIFLAVVRGHDVLKRTIFVLFDGLGHRVVEALPHLV